MKKYDVIVIGGGAGGLTVAAGAASLGAKVALIEKNSELGGDCLHYGCVPSKAFITAAKEVHETFKSAKKFGLKVEGTAPLEHAMNRVKEAISIIQEHDSKERFKQLGIDLFEGKGYLKTTTQVQINKEKTIEGKRIVLATGSRPNIPPIDGLLEAGFLTNETLFEVKKAPKRLLVIGGGPIGLEMAQSFARFGSEVTIMEGNSTIFSKEDEEIVPIVLTELQKEMTFRFNVSIKKVEKKENEKIVTFEQNGKIEELIFDEILLSAGRKPNTDGLGLEEVGVTLKHGYAVVNEYLQTNVPTIYAVGDVNGQFQFTHAAGMEGKVVVRNAVFGIKGKVKYDHVPWVTYTDPEVFHLGLTEREAKETHGDNIRVFKVDVKNVDRFVSDRDAVGLLKVITNEKGTILGAHAVGKNAGDWMQEITFAKAQGHKIGDISNVIHPYPTHGAIIQQAADQYWREKLFNGWVPKVAETYIKWFR
ncbi:FAD-dependent oxidoreductase [Metabacillus iocasae]|uniref:Pyruvate/2-oxoglutarate dehydrogenase complex dihydrolipoamide dehydrogenase (E3) component n=1 Tax=Priestia iocasae TaxID=2291674 RepID=A0ABS2QS06_9BACI|nr:pyruvate/2-oxoglutarate dehydrogenase complex dihydrolipoamide dehydrogenase (E3) component [Metabacillus iocasae]